MKVQDAPAEGRFRGFVMGALAGVALACCWAPLAMAQAPAQPADQVGYAAAWTFYTPLEFFRLFGQVQTGPPRLALCNLTAEPIFARAEWTTKAQQALALEGFLDAGECLHRELAAGEEPHAALIRTSWRELGRWKELRP